MYSFFWETKDYNSQNYLDRYKKECYFVGFNQYFSSIQKYSKNKTEVFEVTLNAH